VLLLLDDLRDLILGQPVALDHRGVVRGEQPGGLPQRSRAQRA
jgi:hypothetical protein